MPTNQDKENNRLVNILEKCAVGALMLIVTWQWNAIGKIEDRVYELQSKAFTVDQSRILEDRLTKQMDAIRADVKNITTDMRNDLNGKFDLLIKMQADNGRK